MDLFRSIGWGLPNRTHHANMARELGVPDQPPAVLTSHTVSTCLQEHDLQYIGAFPSNVIRHPPSCLESPYSLKVNICSLSLFMISVCLFLSLGFKDRARNAASSEFWGCLSSRCLGSYAKNFPQNLHFLTHTLFPRALFLLLGRYKILFPGWLFDDFPATDVGLFSSTTFSETNAGLSRETDINTPLLHCQALHESRHCHWKWYALVRLICRWKWTSTIHLEFLITIIAVICNTFVCGWLEQPRHCTLHKTPQCLWLVGSGAHRRHRGGIVV